MRHRRSALVLCLLTLALASRLHAAGARASMGNEFLYQGRLFGSSGAISGQCDLRFALFDAETGPTALGSQDLDSVALNRGVFTVVLNRGSELGAAPFDGSRRWLEIAVRCPAGSGDFTVLEPRQELCGAPYSLYSKTAPWSGLAGMPAGFADGVDDDTLYGAGTGLTLSGGQFGVVFDGAGSANAAARSDHTHGTAAFRTIQTPAGTPPVAETDADTLQLGSADGTISVTGSDSGGVDAVDLSLADGAVTSPKLATDSVSDDHIQDRMHEIFVFPLGMRSLGALPYDVNDLAGLGFSDGADAAARFSFPVPQDWVGSGNLVVTIFFSGDMIPLSNQTVVWQLGYNALGSMDLLAVPADGVASGSLTLSSLYPVFKIVTATVALQAEHLQGKTFVAAKLTRPAASSASDTYTGTAVLHALRIDYMARR